MCHQNRFLCTCNAPKANIAYEIVFFSGQNLISFIFFLRIPGYISKKSMADTRTCICASIIHLLLRRTTFIEQPKHSCAPGVPAIASIFVFIAIQLLLLDINVYPDRYQPQTSTVFRLFVELIEILIITEFGMCVIWCSLEQLIESLMKRIFLDSQLNLYQDMGGDTFTGFIITLLSFGIFINVVMATKLFDKFRSIWNSAEVKRCRNAFCAEIVALPSTLVKTEAEYAISKKESEKSHVLEAKPKRQTRTRKRVFCLQCASKDCLSCPYLNSK